MRKAPDSILRKKKNKAHGHSKIHCKIEDRAKMKSDNFILLLMESKKLNVPRFCG